MRGMTGDDFKELLAAKRQAFIDGELSNDAALSFLNRSGFNAHMIKTELGEWREEKLKRMKKNAAAVLHDQ